MTTSLLSIENVMLSSCNLTRQFIKLCFFNCLVNFIVMNILIHYFLDDTSLIMISILSLSIGVMTMLTIIAASTVLMWWKCRQRVSSTKTVGV